MRSVNFLPILLLLVFQGNLRAQHPIFISQGKIEFEKKFNVWAQLESMHEDEAWMELTKKRMPKFKTTYFDLVFSGSKTLYKPGRENPENNSLWSYPAEDNIVYSELDQDKYIGQKKMYGDVFNIQDSTRKIKWKMTDETKSIAGFTCRRANAIVMDSIYVVAFYTEEILSTGGPESFNGLPGMILGIALPHQHITWFATKVLANDVLEANIVPPTKGKKINQRTLRETLTDRLKDWGPMSQIYQQALEY
jgi:GLPGLI family protein